MLQLDVQGQRGFRRHRGGLRVNDVRMQGASGLGRGHAKAESLAGVTQEVRGGWSLHGKWQWLGLEREGLIPYSEYQPRPRSQGGTYVI